MRYIKGDFAVSPRMTAVSGLAPHLQVLFFWLHDYPDEIPTLEAMAATCGFSRLALEKAWKELVKLHVIEETN